MPAYGRHPSAQLIEIQSRHFLVDCGEGAQMQLMKVQANLHRIGHIFITHLHGDHYLGLMGLLFTMHLNRRTNDLHLYSFKGLDEIITTQLRYSQSAPSFRIIFHTLKKDVREVIFEDEALTVETIPLVHKIACSGFLFREKPKPRRIDKQVMPEGLRIQDIAALKRGEDVYDDDGQLRYSNAALTLAPRKSRSYAYCSDTAYHEPLIDQLRDIDILYHEATFTEDEAAKAAETRHSTAAQAATMALKANVGKLLLGHFSARYRELAPILAEAQNIFAHSELAEEGLSFTINE